MSPAASYEEIIQSPWKLHRIFRSSLKLEWYPENREALTNQKIGLDLSYIKTQLP